MRPLLLCALTIILFSTIISCQKGFTIDDVPAIIDSIPKDSIPKDSIPKPDTLKTLQILSITPDSAMAGDTIFLTGTGFSTLTTSNISINGLPLSIISISDTTLSLKLPEDFTSGPITIITVDTSIISAISIVAVTQDSVIVTSPWRQRASIRDGYPFSASAFSIGNKGYFFSNGLKEYDPLTNLWTSKARPPLSFGKGFSFVVNGKLYAGAANDGEYLVPESNEVWQYDPKTDKWTRKADFPGTPRLQPYYFATANYGYIGGGDSTILSDNSNDFWRYDPINDTWKRMNDYPGNKVAGFEMFRGFTLNNIGYVFEAGAGPLRAPIGDRRYVDPPLWKYLESTDSWEEKQSFDKVIEFYTATIFTINNRAYLIIGIQDPPVVNGQLKKDNFWEYNADTNKWTQRTDVPDKERFFSQSFSIGNKGYVGLGSETYFEDIHEDFWEYTPE